MHASKRSASRRSFLVSWVCVGAVWCSLLPNSIVAQDGLNNYALGTDQQDWPQWRGPNGNGVSHSANPPITWSETENLRWKVPIPGHGHGTPIVWGDSIFLQTAIPLVKNLPVPDVIPAGTPNIEVNPGESVVSWKAQQFVVLCLDRSRR